MGGPTMGWILKGFSYCSAKVWHCGALEERWDPQVLELPCRAKDGSFPQTLEPVCSCGCFGASQEALSLPRGEHGGWAGSRAKREVWPFVWLLRKAALVAMPPLQPRPKNEGPPAKLWETSREQVWGFSCVCGYATRGVIPTWTVCLHLFWGGDGAQPLWYTCV